MLQRGIRHVQILPFLLAVCHLTLAFPAQTPSALDDVRQLQVNIPHSGPVSAPLGSSISIPCLVSLSSVHTTTTTTTSSTPTSSSSPSPLEPRVKWSVVSGGVETQILVARGQRIKMNEAYRERAAWLNYTSSPDDLSLWLGDLRSSDSGHYRCEVQQGLEDASDLVQLKVKGVVFHYRDADGRYEFTFHQAQRACEAIGAQIATPDQLLAAYHDGYEQCDAGWLADQSVRYPIQVPREGCYGDMDGQPGVRNYGTMDPDDLFDVYCYVEEIDGEVFHDPIPQQLSFQEAQSHCRAAGAELATTAQLYFAWSEGLDRCSPGWLSDGSVRYPILTPRDRCGGPQPGVKTLYRFSNQTGFPEPSSLHDLYCFKESKNTHTDSPVDYAATEPEDIGQDVVILVGTDQELQLNQNPEQVELKAQSVLKAIPFFFGLSTEESPVDTQPTPMSETTESPLNTTPTLEHLQTFNGTLSPTERSNNSQHPTALMNSTVTATEVHDSPHNSSLLPSVYNNSDSQHNLNITFYQLEPENTTGFPESSYEPHTDNQTVPDTFQVVNTQPSERPKDFQEIQDANLNFDGSQANYSETESNHTQEESFREVTLVTLEPMLLVTQEEAAAEDPENITSSTQALKEVKELVTQSSPTTKSSISGQSLSWTHLDGSGDNSQERELDVKTTTFVSKPESFTGYTTHWTPSASTSDTPAEAQTTLPSLTLSSQSPNSDKLGLDILSTARLFWESSNSRQEGSTSLESEDTVAVESEEQLQPTKSGDSLFAGVNLTTTESPESSSTSEVPNDPITARYQTSGYRMYLASATTGYEEASGHEPGTVTATFGEEEVEMSRITEEENTLNLTLGEEGTITPATEEETKVSPTIDEKATYFFSLEEKAPPGLAREEEATVAPIFDEENIAPTLSHEGEAIVYPTFEETNIAPTLAFDEGHITPTLEEEAAVTSTIVPTLEEENIISMLEGEQEIAPTPEEQATVLSTLEDGENIAPTLEDGENIAHTLEDGENIAPTLEDGENIAPTFEEEATVGPTLDEDNIAPTFEEENIAPDMEEGVTVAPSLEEEANISQALEEAANVAPILEEDFTIFPFDSQTSQWSLLTTTTGPQESLNELEHRRKTSTAAPNSVSSAKATAATSKRTAATITTTPHWNRRTWSPTTLAPNVFRKTAEPKRVTAFQPPVDQGLGDVEFSLTQPPTLLILPNERAAVGGAGKVSDACMDDPCFNGGTCSERDGKIKCLCLPTYGGDFCQTDVEQCELGWDKFQGFCYRHFGQRLSWEVAEQHCRMLGAHLVSILTPEEQNYINSNYKEYQWTGLNDKTIEDDFRWTDGNPLLYENWYRGQPDSYFLSGEDCVVMVWHDDGRWSDVPCNYHLSYTCKKGTSSCGPPPRVRNASTFGKVRQRYETNAVVRYHCAQGFQQRLNPVIQCLSGGRWERPQILCIPESGGPTQQPEVMSQTNSQFDSTEDELEATKEKPLYWDIKF